MTVDPLSGEHATGATFGSLSDCGLLTLLASLTSEDGTFHGQSATKQSFIFDDRPTGAELLRALVEG